MLVRPRMNAIDIDGSGDLVISRNPSALHLDLNHESNVKSNITHWSFVQLPQRTRIGRFLHAMKFVWKHCK